MTRGITFEQEKWKKYMETHMWPLRRHNLKKDANGDFIPLKNEDGTPKLDENGYQVYEKEGEPYYTLVSGALRPIQLWEYVIPEDGNMEIDGKIQEWKNYWSLMAMFGIWKNEHLNLRSETKLAGWLARKGMKLEKIPPIPEFVQKMERFKAAGNRFLPMEAFCVYPLGIRKDITRDFLFQSPDGKTKIGYNQEGL